MATLPAQRLRSGPWVRGALFATLLMLPGSVVPSRAGASAPGLALVELFTSQGCSSCPPADAVLAQLTRNGEPDVYVLSFHVDYWNDLGWADPYSQASFSERQRRYARALGERVYTPQLIVNGRQSMVGSRAGEVRAAVERARSAASATPLTLSHQREARRVRIRPQVPPGTSGLRFYAAVVQRRADNTVARGENAGRRLHHVNVVRSLVSGAAGQALEVVLPDLPLPELGVVGWLQEPESMGVVAVGRLQRL